jgi:carnitine-CoA ligase
MSTNVNISEASAPEAKGVLGEHFDATLPSLIQSLAVEQVEHTLVSHLGVGEVTANELWTNVSNLAAGLIGLGVSQGDRVAAMLSNGLELIELVFAVTLAGGVFVPMNTAWRGRSLEHIVQDSEPIVLAVDATLRPDVLELAQQRSGITTVVVGDTDGERSGAVRFSTLRKIGAGHEFPAVAAEDLALLLYTSGTTGQSKGNMISHRASLWMAATAADTLGYSDEDIVHSCLPLFHANALQCGLFGALLRGARFVFSSRFSASRFWEEVSAAGATHTSLLGSMMPLLMAQPAGARDRAHSVHTVYCAPMPEHLPVFEQRFGVKCASTYGLTDANIFTVRPADDSGVRSAGVASPDWELAIVDGDGLPVAQGEVGELVGRPRLPYIASSGYWRNPAATTELWGNLWCHSGDLLRQDEEGRYFFVDRKKDAIRKGGENVSSFEVEEVLLGHPAVAEAAVFGIPSELLEDEVMAVLVLHDGVTVTPEEIFATCARELAYFAVPRYIEFGTELPRTENHRVRKRELRERGVSELTWDAGPVTRRRIESMGRA